jgi:hypothetical protein
MANEFIARNGLIALDNSRITGSLNVSGSLSVNNTPAVLGSGTTNRILKLTASSTAGDSLIFDNGTNVLIGTTTTPTPVVGVAFPLTVTSANTTRIRIDSTQATPNSGFGLYANSVQKWSIAMFGATSDFTIYNDALLASAILVKGGSSNVLIGTPTDAGFKLDVNGTGRFTQGVNLATSSGNVGIGTTSPGVNLDVNGGNSSTFVRVARDTGYTMLGAGLGFGVIYSRNSSDVPRNFIIEAANVGIGTESPSTTLNVGHASHGIGVAYMGASSLPPIAGIFTDSSSGQQGFGSLLIKSRTDFANYSINFYTAGTANVIQERMRITSGGNVGIGTANPLATLSTLGGAVQIMGDVRNHQTIIKSAGTAGTYSGALTITIPQMSGAGNNQGFGGYSCEVYVSGFSGAYCHAWFSGYNNVGITDGETTILRSSGGWSISQSANGQGFVFTLDYTSITHPTVRIIFNKGGDTAALEYPANLITAVFS